MPGSGTKQAATIAAAARCGGTRAISRSPTGTNGVPIAVRFCRLTSSGATPPLLAVEPLTASRATTREVGGRKSSPAGSGPITCGGGTASRPRNSMGCSRRRADCARSVEQRRPLTWTTTMTPARSASCCASPATAGSGSSRTTPRCSVQPPATSNDTGPCRDPSAAGRSPANRPVGAGGASPVTGGAATGSPAGGRCRRAVDRRATASMRSRAGAARCPPRPDGHPSGSPVGSPATAREIPARGREADG